MFVITASRVSDTLRISTRDVLWLPICSAAAVTSASGMHRRAVADAFPPKASRIRPASIIIARG